MTACLCRRHAWNPRCPEHPPTARPFDPDWRVAPGETIREVMEERGIDRYDLAHRMRSRRDVVDGLLAGTEPLTLELAVKLEKALGISRHFWVAHEDLYRKPKTREAG